MSLASLLASVVPGLLPHGSSPPLQVTATLARKTRYTPQHTHHASLLPMFTFYVQLYLAGSAVCSRIPRALALKSRIFSTFGLGPASHGWIAISVISLLVAIDLNTFPLLSLARHLLRTHSPSPLVAMDRRRSHSRYSPAPRTQATRPRASCPLCPLTSRSRRIAHLPYSFEDVKLATPVLVASATSSLCRFSFSYPHPSPFDLVSIVLAFRLGLSPLPYLSTPTSLG
ncbi:hypothetical protein EDB83DRAFT_2678622 [Lactarius deliciosus]|nr:hypothetical protein EDB83DRAFT_2678622 [Lactarius deliciosus]